MSLSVCLSFIYGLVFIFLFCHLYVFSILIPKKVMKKFTKKLYFLSTSFTFLFHNSIMTLLVTIILLSLFIHGHILGINNLKLQFYSMTHLVIHWSIWLMMSLILWHGHIYSVTHWVSLTFFKMISSIKFPYLSKMVK